MGLVALAALLPLLGGSPAPASDDVAARVAEVLAGDTSPVGRAAELVELGPDALPPLLDALASGAARGAGREVVFETFRRLPRSTSRELLEEVARDAGSTDADSRAVLEVLGAIGRAEDLPLVVEIGERLAARRAPDLTRTLTGSVESVLARDERAWVGLSAVVRSAAPGVADALLRGIGRVGGADALESLFELLGTPPERDLAVLSEIAVVASALAGGEFPADERERARAYLRDEDMQVVRAAASAVGAMRDEEAVRDLVELLSHESTGVRSSASWALRRVTGLALGEDAARWKAWLEVEHAWFEARAETLFGDLRARDTRIVRAALQELGLHRYRASTIAGHAVEALRHGDAAVRRTACSVLGGLGVRRTAPALVELLDDERTADAARSALVALTGLDLPADRRAWTDAL